MKAAIFRGGNIVVDTLPAPKPDTGQALVKVLGQGELSKAVTVHAHKFSKTAQEKIEKAGGKIQVL